MRFSDLYNPFVRALLRSPLHGLISGGVMLLSYPGRRSGRRYTLPVNYLQHDDVLLILSQNDRTWWRNLRGGAPVIVRLRAEDLAGVGQVLAETPEAVAAGLEDYFRMAPSLARYFGVTFESEGQPRRSDLERVAQNRVILRVCLKRAAHAGG